jgi:hypothetical protein
MADLKADAQDWRILRTPHPQGQFYVAVDKNVLTRSAEGILQTRDGILRNLWPMLLGFIVLVTIVLTRAALKPVQTLQQARTSPLKTTTMNLPVSLATSMH